VHLPPGRRSRTVRVTSGQRAQRPRLARGAGPGGGAVSRPGSPALTTRRCGLRATGGVRVPGGRGVPVHDPPTCQPSARGADRPSAHAPGGPATALRAALLRELPLSGAELEPVAPGRCEGGVAPRRTVPARRFHRDEPASLSPEGRRLLQRTRNGRAV